MSNTEIIRLTHEYKGPDHTTERGAQGIAKRIVRYWAMRGRRERGKPYAVVATIRQHQFSSKMRRSWYSVETDMINGYPRDHPRCVA